MLSFLFCLHLAIVISASLLFRPFPVCRHTSRLLKCKKILYFILFLYYKQFRLNFWRCYCVGNYLSFVLSPFSSFSITILRIFVQFETWCFVVSGNFMFERNFFCPKSKNLHKGSFHFIICILCQIRFYRDKSFCQFSKQHWLLIASTGYCL
jgi:hypothetical protein